MVPVPVDIAPTGRALETAGNGRRPTWLMKNRWNDYDENK